MMEKKDQPGCSRVTIPLPANNLPLIEILHLGLSFADEAKKRGGKARCFKTANSVIVEQSGISRDQIEPLINCLGSSHSMNVSTLSVIVEERDAPEIDLDAEGVIPGEITRERLTKKFLFGLPDGAIVIGNWISNGEPTFAVRLEPGRDRSRIWRRAVNAQADQRICSVYWNPEDVLEVHGIDVDTWDGNDESAETFPTFRM
jgi:hypothetical protein